MYEVLFIPKKYTVFSIQQMQTLVEKYADGTSIEKNDRGITLRKGNNYLSVTYTRSPIVLEEANEMAKQFGVPIEQTDDRFEMYGKDDDDVLYNQFLWVYESLRDNHLFYTLDSFTGKSTPLTSNMLQEFIYANEYIKVLEQEIVNIQQKKFNSTHYVYDLEPRYLSLEITRVQWVGVKHLEDLVDLLHTKRKEILAMAERFVQISDSIYLGTFLRYLSYELIAATQDEARITQFVQDCVDNEVYKKTQQGLV